MNGMSKQLKTAMAEINEVLQKHDIAGAIFLADGKKNGEFSINFDKPSWSVLSFEDLKDGTVKTHIKVRKDKQEEADRTVNSIFNIHGQMSHMWLGIEQITKALQAKINIQVDAGKITPGPLQ